MGKVGLFWSSLISYHVATHRGCQPLPQFIKMATMALLLIIETKRSKQHQVWVNIKLECIVSHLGWQPLQEISKMTAMALPLDIKTFNEII